MSIYIERSCIPRRPLAAATIFDFEKAVVGYDVLCALSTINMTDKRSIRSHAVGLRFRISIYEMAHSGDLSKSNVIKLTFAQVMASCRCVLPGLFIYAPRSYMIWINGYSTKPHTLTQMAWNSCGEGGAWLWYLYIRVCTLHAKSDDYRNKFKRLIHISSGYRTHRALYVCALDMRIYICNVYRARLLSAHVLFLHHVS